MACTHASVFRLFSTLSELIRHPRLREVLAWCAPALVLGAVLRVMLCVDMPYAYYHDDAPDFLTTPDRLIYEHKIEFHEKKTFLVPLLFTVPFLLPAPALVTIPVAQHLMGLGTVFLIGALCRFWLAGWRIWIIPLTVLAAVNPFFLWYEHTLMAEAVYIFCMVLVALAGTLYGRSPSGRRFAWLCVSLVLLAGARPEGKLLFGFGLFFLVLMHWRQRPLVWKRAGILVLVALGTHLITKTSQGGLLLYTAVARLTPTELSSAPGLDPYIAPIRADLQRRWEERPQFPRVRDRKALADAVEKYLKDEPTRGRSRRQTDVNKFCLKLARETCLRNLEDLPSLALAKFRLVANESPAGRLDNDMLFGKQREAFTDSLSRTLRLSHGLTGVAMNGKEVLQRWIDTHYGEVKWFNRLSDRWLAAVNAWRMPDQKFKNSDPPFFPIFYYGIPFYFIVATVGLFAAMLRTDGLRAFHLSWGLALVGFFFVIMLTANVRPRFRFVFEPFWFIYIALLVDTLWLGVRGLIRR